MFQMDDDSGNLSKSMPPVSFMNSGSERVTGRGQRNRSHSGHTSESSDVCFYSKILENITKDNNIATNIT